MNYELFKMVLNVLMLIPPLSGREAGWYQAGFEVVQPQ